MNDYEVLLMLDAELPEERGGEIVARVREQVEGDKGSWDGHEPWGRRKLAYEIDHKAEGVYHLLLFTSSPETLADAREDLRPPLLGELGVEQEQNLVVVHVPNLPSHGLSRPRPGAPLRVTARRTWREVAAV